MRSGFGLVRSVLRPVEEPLPPNWVYVIRDVGLDRTLSFDPMFFFQRETTGSGAAVMIRPISLASCGAKSGFSFA